MTKLKFASGTVFSLRHRGKGISWFGWNGSQLQKIRSVLMLWGILFGGYSCKNNTSAHVINTDVYYTCSMDPQVVEYKPGKCPICHMALTPVKKNSIDNKDEIQLSEQQVKLGNIKTDTIRTGMLSDEQILTATLNMDQTKIYAVSSRVPGRIEKLFVKNLGDFIKKGDPVFQLYSEELNNAKQEYLLALEQEKNFRGESSIRVDELVQSARNKLFLWGMNEAQLRELEATGAAMPWTIFYSPVSGYATELPNREGDYVMEGSTIVKLADLSTLWAEAQVYTSQLYSLTPKSIATVTLPGFEGNEIRGTIEFVNPEISPDTRINLVRVSIPNPAGIFKPGMPAYVVLKSTPATTITLPINAVLRDSKGASVWIKTGIHSFKNKMVTVGMESGDKIEIKSGLSAGDVIVITGAYLLQSEYIFKKGANPVAGHNH